MDRLDGAREQMGVRGFRGVQNWACTRSGTAPFIGGDIIIQSRVCLANIVSRAARGKCTPPAGVFGKALIN